MNSDESEKFQFDKLEEFQKEFKHFLKKYKSLPKDLREFEKSISVSPLGNKSNFTVLKQNDILAILKARFFCRYLKGKSLRIIYAYFKGKRRVEFIEIYSKGESEKENKKRVTDYFKNYRLKIKV